MAVNNLSENNIKREYIEGMCTRSRVYLYCIQMVFKQIGAVGLPDGTIVFAFKLRKNR